MVLRLKTRESRSLPGLLNATHLLKSQTLGTGRYQRPHPKRPFAVLKLTRHPSRSQSTRVRAAPADPQKAKAFEDRQSKNNRALALRSLLINAGWSSPVARQAHNLKAAGSNPAPATRKFQGYRDFIGLPSGGRKSYLSLTQRPASHFDTSTTPRFHTVEQRESKRKQAWRAMKSMVGKSTPTGR